MQRMTGTGYRALLAGMALLLAMSAFSSLFGQSASAQTEEAAEDVREKAADLTRALANGGVSPDRLVVLYDAATTPNDAVQLRVRRQTGGRLLRADHAISRDVLRVPNGSAQTVAQLLRGLPGVRDAYADPVASISLAVNDPLLPNEWGLAKIQAGAAWDTSQAQGVTVAVLDCGVRAGHPDLAGKVVLERNFTGTATTDDRCNHGTHVAGTIGAVTNNGAGVAAVAPAAKLLNGKVLDDRGSGFFSDIDRAIQWAADNGAKVINMSLGGNIACPSGTQAAANYAWSRGAVLVAAAGNSGRSGAGAPANCQNVIGVAATDSGDAKPSWSNYGPEVDVAAPGVSILSTVNPDVNGGSQYASFSGTSMATPHTAGVLALIWVTSHGTSPAAVRDRLFNTADRIGGTGSLWTYGRINAATAVAGGGNPPPAVHDVAVTGVTAPASVAQGTTASISVAAANPGNFGETFTVSLTETPPGGGAATTIGSQSVTLAAGASTTLTFSWATSTSTPTGAHTLTATAAAAEDSNVANNSKAATVNVTQPSSHDVAVTGITAPSQVTRGSRARIRVTVANQGTAAESFTVTLRDGPTSIGSRNVSGLAAGASTTLSLNWFTSSSTAIGAHTLTATASTVPGETDTADNSQSVTITVTLRQ